MKNRWIVCGAVLCGASFFVGQVIAQDEGGDKPGGGFPIPAWTQKTKEHESLKKFVGTWDAEEEFNMGGQVIKSKGVAVAKLALGGMYLQQDYQGTMMGQAWQGRLYVGYDTVDKQHVAIWMDSVSPVMAVSRGVEKDGVMILEGMQPDHMDPKGTKKKSVLHLKWIDADSYQLLVFDGANQVGKITYTRKK